MKHPLFLFVWIILFWSIPLQAAGGVGTSLDPHYLPDVLVDNQVERWSDTTGTITVYISPHVPVAGYVDCIKSAFLQWEQALNQKVKFGYVGNPDSADIRIFWTNTLAGGEQVAAHTIVGKTKDHQSGKTMIYKIDTLFRTHSPYTGNPFTKEEIQTTALHEVGHILGIRGHSTNPDDVMYQLPGGNRPVNLSSRDIETIRRLYESQAQITNPPDIPLAQFRVFMDDFLQGLKYFEQSHYEQAFAKFEAAFHRYPQHRLNRFFVGMSAFFTGQYDTAIFHLSATLDPSPPDPPGINRLIGEYALGESYFKRGLDRCRQSQYELANLDLYQALTYLKQCKTQSTIPQSFLSSVNRELDQLESAFSQVKVNNEASSLCEALLPADGTQPAASDNPAKSSSQYSFLHHPHSQNHHIRQTPP